MKLSTLYEVRDPKKEAELEPYLTAPFRSEKERGKEGRRLAKQSHKDYGLPDRQFMSNPTLKHTGDYSNKNFQYRKQYGQVEVPVLGPGGTLATSNPKSDNTSLNQAIGYWSKKFEGERWPALEQAFLNRNWTFKGGRGLYDTARSSLFKYLNELKTPWPQGEEMANTVLSSRNALHYVIRVPEIKKYIQLHPVIPGLVTQINKVFPPYKDELEFHTDDVFGGHQRYSDSDIRLLQQYAAKHVPGPTPPSEAELFNQRLRDIEQRPPFVGWA